MAERDKIRFLTHFTDKRNLESIREHGLCSLARLRDMGVDIPAPGGSPLSHELDTSKGLDRYVHLGFTYGHPMIKIAQDDGRIVECRFIGFDLKLLDLDGLLFGPDNTAKNGVPVYPLAQALEEKLIDWPSLYDIYPWGPPEGQARRQKVDRYELLIPDMIPVELLKIPK